MRLKLPCLLAEAGTSVPASCIGLRGSNNPVRSSSGCRPQFLAG